MEAKIISGTGLINKIHLTSVYVVVDSLVFGAASASTEIM